MQSKGYCFLVEDVGMSLQDPELNQSTSFEMNWPQTYMGQVFMLV